MLLRSEPRALVVAHHAVLSIPLVLALVLATVVATDVVLGRAVFVDPFGGSHTESQVPDVWIDALELSLGAAVLTVPIALAFVLAGALARLRHHGRWIGLWISGWAAFALLLVLWDIRL